MWQHNHFHSVSFHRVRRFHLSVKFWEEKNSNSYEVTKLHGRIDEILPSAMETVS